MRPPTSSDQRSTDSGNTSLLDTETQQTQLEQRLISLQRLASLGTLSAMIAHEFNNLMTPILARADFALSTNEPADMHKALERAKVQVQRAISVSRQLLAYSRDEQTPVVPQAVRAAVEEAVATSTRPLEKDGIELQIDVPDELRVQAQPDLLVQVLLNLLLNARNAMKGHRGPLKISARPDNDFVTIDVVDSGKGMPAEQMHEVINPFLAAPVDSSDPDAWRSVGLGLNACRLIAQRHRATIEGRLNQGRGCTFRLRWPAA